jgi:hypothetical protein
MRKHLRKLIITIVLGCCLGTSSIYNTITVKALDKPERNQSKIADREKEEVFTTEELREDLDFLIKNLEEIHPNIYHSVNKEEFQREVKEVREGFKDSMTDVDFYSKTAPLVSKLREGHTWINWPGSIEKKLFNGKGRVFPYKIKLFEDRIFITDTIDSNNSIPIGSEIIAINAWGTEDIIKDCLKYTSGELDHYKKSMIEDKFSTKYVTVYDFSDTYSIMYKDAEDNKYKTAAVEGIDYRKFIEHDKKINSQYKNYSYTYLEDINTGYIQFNSFYDFKAFEEFLNNTFQHMKEKKAENLIIDIRKNGGGNAALGDLLVCYITDKKFRRTEGGITKISVPLIKHWENSLKNIGYEVKVNKDYTEIEIPNGNESSKFKVGTYKDNNNEERRPFDVKDIFKGKVYVLTGPQSFSSSAMFSSIVKDYDLGTIIGEETGGTAGGYTDNSMFRLPNTKILCCTSNCYFTRPSGKKTNRGVMPDFQVKQTVEEYLKGEDAVMNFTKELIKNT